jgi:7,8-dihydropterin-6-yl-methyl-4-(beta-D-ribofuranosyl)aminobenzene 5'-phosphate synthase
MGIRITTLSENTASIGDFLAEWGLSMLIETDKTNVLLDTGKGCSSVYNADTLGIDLRAIDKIFLSHGHFDHTGGLHEILRRMRKKVEVIAHPDIWQLKYSRRENEVGRYIGIPFQRSELEGLGAMFVLNENPVKIDDSIMTTGEVPMTTSFEEIDAMLFLKKDSVLQPDQVMDDQALIVRTKAGLVVILGCAHRGMINTLYHARQLTGENKIYAVMGGSHLMDASEERLWQTIAALRDLGIQKLGLCHCTDLRAISLLAQEFGDALFFNKAGTVIEIP